MFVDSAANNGRLRRRKNPLRDYFKHSLFIIMMVLPFSQPYTIISHQLYCSTAIAQGEEQCKWEYAARGGLLLCYGFYLHCWACVCVTTPQNIQSHRILRILARYTRALPKPFIIILIIFLKFKENNFLVIHTRSSRKPLPTH